MARMLVALVAVLALTQFAAPVSAADADMSSRPRSSTSWWRTSLRQHPTLVKMLMDNSECPMAGPSVCWHRRHWTLRIAHWAVTPDSGHCPLCTPCPGTSAASNYHAGGRCAVAAASALAVWAFLSPEVGALRCLPSRPAPLQSLVEPLKEAAMMGTNLTLFVPNENAFRIFKPMCNDLNMTDVLKNHVVPMYLPASAVMMAPQGTQVSAPLGPHTSDLPLATICTP